MYAQLHTIFFVFCEIFLVNSICKKTPKNTSFLFALFRKQNIMYAIHCIGTLVAVILTRVSSNFNSFISQVVARQVKSGTDR